jgi:peptide/nickel transport system substrate-binding protein
MRTNISTRVVPFAAILALVVTGIVACAAPAAQPTSAPPTQAPAAATTAPQPTAAPAATTAPQPTTAAATTAPPAASADTLRIGLDVDAGTGDPRLARDTSANRLRELVFDGLVGLGPDYVPVPALAESWENPDPTTWVFHLRPGVKFHDGSPLTANDVKFTFDTILDEKFASPNRSFYTPIKKIDVVDDLTVKFTLDQPYSPFLSYLTMPIVPKAIAEKDAAGFANSPVGTGPYKFVEWKRGDTITFEANPDYWGGAPKTKNVVFKIVPDNSARVVALESGDLDFVQSPVSPQDVTRLQSEGKFAVERIPAAGYTYINLNCADPILSDVKVRQALSYLVNREDITSSIYKGIGKVAKGPIPPGMWAYTEDLPTYTYDPAKAAQLLDEAGWKLGADGKRAKDGKPLKITVRTHSEDPDRRQLIEVLQAELANVGIEADTNAVDFATYFADVQAGKYQMGVIGWLNLANPDQAMFRQFTVDGAGNYGHCNNEEASNLIKEARATLDQEKAKELYAQAAKLVVENAFYIFVQYQEYIAMHRKDMQGFVMNPVQNFRTIKDVTIGQ